MSASYRIVILLLFLLAGPVWAEEGSPVKAAAPTALPVLPYQDETGAVRSLDFSGAALTALHFWATWCAPCVEELPELDKTAAAYQKQGFRAVSLSLDTNQAKVETFFKDHKITALTPYLDPKTVAYRALKLRGLPTTILVNAQGKEVARHEGPVDWESAETKTLIESLLK